MRCLDLNSKCLGKTYHLGVSCCQNSKTKVSVLKELPQRRLALNKLPDHLGVWCGPGSSVGIATDYGLDSPQIESRWGARFSVRPDRTWGPPSLLYNGYRVFPEGKVRPGRAADHSPPSSAEVLEE